MIDQTTLMTYVAVVLGFVFIPGPATLLTIARSTGSGTRAGIATGLGIAVGDIIHTALAVVGVSAIILTSALLFSLIKYMGAAYLVYLGVKALLSGATAQLQAGAGGVQPKQAFRQAVVAEVLNPKSALFFLAFLPQFVDPANGWIALQLMIFGVVFVALGLLSTVVFALCAGSLGQYLRQNPFVARLQQKAVGLLFCFLGVRLAIQER